MARTRHDRKRIEALLRKRERQGLTWLQLSSTSGVPVSTLSWWSSRLRREGRSTASRGSFVELLPASEDPTSSSRVEIVLRSGVQLLVREEIEAAALRRLVAALES